MSVRQSLPFQRVQHKVETRDAQPTGADGTSLAVMVTGALVVSHISLPLLHLTQDCSSLGANPVWLHAETTDSLSLLRSTTRPSRCVSARLSSSTQRRAPTTSSTTFSGEVRHIYVFPSLMRWGADSHLPLPMGTSFSGSTTAKREQVKGGLVGVTPRPSIDPHSAI